MRKFICGFIFYSVIISCTSESQQNPELVLENRDGVVYDLFNIGAVAQLYHRKAGKRSFKGFEIPENLLQTQNGKYYLENIDDDSLYVVGIGKYKGNDNLNFLKIRLKVLRNMVEQPVEIN